jgi:hypothetical protein
METPHDRLLRAIYETEGRSASAHEIWAELNATASTSLKETNAKLERAKDDGYVKESDGKYVLTGLAINHLGTQDGA